MRTERPHIYVGIYATVVDAGAALGPLLAYFSGAVLSFATLYVIAGIILALAVIQYWRAGRLEQARPTS